MTFVKRAFSQASRALMAASNTSAIVVAPKQGSSAGIRKVVPVSPSLAEFFGAPEVSRTDAMKKVWVYIKENNLQNPSNKKEILCDAKLKTIFNGKDQVGFLEIAKLLSPHFVKSG
uniref:upstream activation factor subunit UAF30-like n=1 Tax=Erigeron canadensis TaxID=72917 RepID=UPI001CB99F3E|nr:upstream activation factor subunit UAF30-like [Erigeron canadensis]